MKKSPLVWIGYVIGFLLFGFFASLQLNDLDPEIYYHPSHLDATLWFLFYLLIAVLFIIGIFKKLPNWLFIIAAIFCLVEMVRTGPGLYENLFGEEEFNMTQVSMSAEDPRVELSREFFGAVIALVGVGALYFAQKRRLKA